jgi:hypothetical protein
MLIRREERDLGFRIADLGFEIEEGIGQKLGTKQKESALRQAKGR